MTTPDLKALSEALLPCPFCGGAAEAISLFRPPHRGNTFVKCKGCGAAGRRGGYGWAISNWNIRTDLPATDEQALSNPKVQALVEALEYADRMCKLDLQDKIQWGDNFSQAVYDTAERIASAIAKARTP